MNKKIAFAMTLVVAAVAVGVAYAYFTSAGSGTGTSAVGADTAFVLHGASASTLYPGTASTVTFTADNPGSGHQQLGTIYLAGVKACYPGAWNGTSCGGGGTEQTTCESVDPGNAPDAAVSDFYMADVSVNHDFAPGAGQPVTPTGTFVMNDLNASQDSCKNASLTLQLSTR